MVTTPDLVVTESEMSNESRFEFRLIKAGNKQGEAVELEMKPPRVKIEALSPSEPEGWFKYIHRLVENCKPGTAHEASEKPLTPELDNWRLPVRTGTNFLLMKFNL